MRFHLIILYPFLSVKIPASGSVRVNTIFVINKGKTHIAIKTQSYSLFTSLRGLDTFQRFSIILYKRDGCCGFLAVHATLVSYVWHLFCHFLFLIHPFSVSSERL